MLMQNLEGQQRIRVCSFWRIQKRIFDPRFAGFRGRKEREIRNCILGNLFLPFFWCIGKKGHFLKPRYILYYYIL